MRIQAKPQEHARRLERFFYAQREKRNEKQLTLMDRAFYIFETTNLEDFEPALAALMNSLIPHGAEIVGRLHDRCAKIRLDSPALEEGHFQKFSIVRVD